MKKYRIFAMFVVLAVALVSPFSVSAETKAGTKSGSFFYFFDKVFEKADLFFTFNSEKKAKKALENAEERLAEAEESANENKPEAVAEAMKDYQKNIEVLEKVLEKVPREAKEAIDKAIEASKERREEMTKKIEEINNEIIKEDNDLKKNEEEKLKSNDDVGNNENGKEEIGNENKNENKKDEQEKEIEKLKKEIETLKQKQPQVKIIEKIEKITEKSVVIESKQSSSSQTNIEKQTSDTKDVIILPQQPRLIRYQDNLGNIYTEKKDFVRKASEPFNHGFGASYTPSCLQGISAINGDCQSEIVNWVNNRSIEIGKSLNITLDSFDANGDDTFYYISYGGRNDWGYGNMRVLQSWGKNETLSFPITEQLYNETLFENLSWGSTFFETETRKYYDKNVKLNNAGELNVQVCFNDKVEKIIDPFGEQFPDGCILFKYFILKSGYSNLTTSTQPQ